MTSTVIISIRYSHATQLGMILGILVFAIGAIITVSSSLFLNISYPKLATRGPYSLSRHPFYLGLQIMLTGIVLYRGSYIGAIFLILSGWVSIARARREEQELIRLYPREYREYMTNTPFIIKTPWWRKKGDYHIVKG